jgi:hypothetical protein
MKCFQEPGKVMVGTLDSRARRHPQSSEPKTAWLASWSLATQPNNPCKQGSTLVRFLLSIFFFSGLDFAFPDEKCVLNSHTCPSQKKFSYMPKYLAFLYAEDLLSFFFEGTAKALPRFLLDGEIKNTSVRSSFLWKLGSKTNNWESASLIPTNFGNIT